jgi:hypothetical protein
MFKVIVTAIISCVLTVAGLRALGMVGVSGTLKFENARAKVSEVVYEPGVPRERSTRATDQIIVFLDDCRYQRTDSKTHEKTIRERKSGDVIWHNKGEDAPVLVNIGSSRYRTIVIELK